MDLSPGHKSPGGYRDIVNHIHWRFFIILRATNVTILMLAYYMLDFHQYIVCFKILAIDLNVFIKACLFHHSLSFLITWWSYSSSKDLLASSRCFNIQCVWCNAGDTVVFNMPRMNVSARHSVSKCYCYRISKFERVYILSRISWREAYQALCHYQNSRYMASLSRNELN